MGLRGNEYDYEVIHISVIGDKDFITVGKIMFI